MHIAADRERGALQDKCVYVRSVSYRFLYEEKRWCSSAGWKRLNVAKRSKVVWEDVGVKIRE